MLQQTTLPDGKTSLRLQVETDHSAVSQDVASRGSTRSLWIGLGIGMLMLVGFAACALHPLASLAPAESSRLVPEVAFNPMPAVGLGGIRRTHTKATGPAVPSGSRPLSRPVMMEGTQVTNGRYGFRQATVGRDQRSTVMQAAGSEIDNSGGKKMKIYTSQGSRAQIIEWYAMEKGLEFESVDVDMRSGAHKRPPFTDVNPFGKMPAIQAADGTPVFESGAILLYMAALAGELQTPEQIGTASKWVLYANAMYWPEVERNRRPPADQLQALEGILSKQAFIAGNDFTVSDVALGSYLYYTAAFFGEKFQSTPKVQAYLKGLMNRPAFQKTCGAS